MTPNWPARWRVARELFRVRAKEYLTHDSRPFKWLVGGAGSLVALAHGARGQRARQLRLLCALHRSNFLEPANAFAMRQLRRAAAGQAPFATVMADHIRDVPRTDGTANFEDHPELITRFPTIVLRSPRGAEKGVLLAHYNHIFPLLAKSIDLERVAEHYYIVLEPSWRGFAELDILCYSRYRFPVFVQSVEPRDSAVLTGVGASFVPVPLSANSWVDHRVFKPLPVEKEYDLTMVAVLSSYKRHAAFFGALSRLRRNGHRLRVLLLGGERQYTRQQILEQAAYYGVADQIDLVPDIPYDEVNEHINRAKVHVLWSRTEGVNRAIVECMFAGLPSIVREGFNYGHHYSYINSQTGCFATEKDLPRTLLDMVERSKEMKPREWAMANMSCQRSTQVLDEAIGAWCDRHQQPWTGGLAVKVTRLNRQKFWDDSDRIRFEADYAFLRDCLRRKVRAA